MKAEILPYQRIGSGAKSYEKTKGKSILGLFSLKNGALLLPTAFLLGRASLMGGITPFGLALYAATAGMGINRIIVSVLAILGMISGGAAKEQIYITTAAMLLFYAINIPFKNSKPKLNFRYAVTAFVSVIIPEIVTVCLQGLLLYDLLRSIFQAFLVFSLVFVFRKAIPVIAPSQKKHIYSNEEIISVAIIAVLALSGFSNIQVFGFTLRSVMCMVLILVFGYKCGPGVGSAVGVTVGLLASMSVSTTPLVIGSYAFCGLLAGLFKDLGKVGSSLGFVMGNAVLTLYSNGSTDVLIYLKEIVLAVTVFMLTPQKFIEIAVGVFNRNTDTCMDKRGYSERIKEITVERLNKFSTAFKELSKTFGDISETAVVTEKQDISYLFDRVADKVCKNCSLCLHCWDRNFHNTYQIMFKIVEKLDVKGRVEENDIPGYFMERCERINEFISGINSIYELFKVDLVWKSKIGESRGLVSQQMEGLSGIIANLASEIDMDIHFKGDMEDVILMELNKSGIKASEVMVFENKWGKYEINVFHKGCGGKRNCVSTIEKLVSDVTGRKVAKENGDCGMDSKGSSCTLRLVEQETLSVNTGIARLAKYDGMVSGDNYTFMNSGDGKYIVALSDGMGSGQKAAVQSRATINLLEQFIDAGFDKDTTVRLINSILVLKSSDDSFATIDLSAIDLYSGEVEFVKVGAVPTFIKRGDTVEAVRSASLPAGILSNIEMELVHKTIQSGNFIIMMTDGIIDSFKKEEGGEETLVKFIQDIKSVNSQEIADSILNEAYAYCNSKPVDDMMVVVAKVWKRVSAA